MNKKALFFFSFAVAAPLAGFCAQKAVAQSAPPTSPSVIGTIDVAPTVTQQGTCAPTPLAKMGIVPLITTDNSDALVRLVVHRDMELAGVYDVLDDAKAPSGPYTRNTGIDLKAWRRKGDVDWVVRVYANTQADKVELIGEGWETPTKEEAGPAPDGGDDANNPPPNPPRPLFQEKVTSPSTQPTAVRLAAHQLTDVLLRKITGTSGSFASQLTYSGPVGQSTHQQAFIIDADGFALHGYGPSNWTALSPTFGPNHELFYALSAGYSKYNLVRGQNATPVNLPVHGSTMNIAFNHDKTKIAFDVFEGGDSKVYVSDANGANVRQVSREPLAHSPVFGPNDMLAYVAGNYAQQVIVNGKPVSPAGAWAAAPTICDTPDGVLVVYTVGFGAGSSLVASDPDGSRVHQLVTSNGGSYPACSPDGRLVAYFSYQNRGQGPGLYVTPIAHPCNGKRIGTSTGESLRWEKIGPDGPM